MDFTSGLSLLCCSSAELELLMQRGAGDVAQTFPLWPSLLKDAQKNDTYDSADSLLLSLIVQYA